jgi:cytoskeletal protein CcmA (bactofilin family)
MWKRREDETLNAITDTGTHDVSAQSRSGPHSMEQMADGIAHIGKSLVVKGDLSGNEDLYVDGELDGSVELRGHKLTIGPNARVRATIHAQIVVIQGKLDGKVHGSERVELRKSAVLVGDIFTQRIAIEEGAYFKGGVDITKEPVAARTDALPEARREAAASVAASSASAASAAGTKTSAPSPQQSFVLNQKK